jgi:hypothetical protein
MQSAGQGETTAFAIGTDQATMLIGELLAAMLRADAEAGDPLS